jgi:N-acetylneuraminic acid mutarotase
MAGTIKNQIHVVGGITNSQIVTDHQIYDPVANTWSTGPALPIQTFGAAVAVVGNVLYVFGGSVNNQNETDAVWAYNAQTNAWTSKKAMPTARVVATAAVDKNIIYVIGGYNYTFPHGVLNIVESYDTKTDTWTEEAPLLVEKSESSVGLFGSTVVAAGGLTASGETGDNEGYSVSANSWTTLTADSAPRNASCGGSIGAKLIVATGSNSSGNAVGNNESFSLSKNKWTTLASIPNGVVDSGSAIYKGKLYCIGGGSVVGQFQGTVFNYVQIYQP